MFIRKKIIKGKEHFYLVESRRENGKVRQKVLAYLGDMDTLEGAISQRERWIKSLNEIIEKRTRKIQEMEDQREQMLRRHAAERGQEYVSTPYPNPSRGSYRGFGGSYHYRNLIEEVEKHKNKIYEIETQIDKLNFYRSA